MYPRTRRRHRLRWKALLECERRVLRLRQERRRLELSRPDDALARL